MNTMLTSTELRQLLNYDPNTGHLTWIKKINKGTVLKSRAGTKQADGYRSVKLYGRKYLEHRLIWCWVHGDYPSQHLDHINHIRDDNRIINLREVTISENARNRLTRNSRTGEKGIWYCRRRKRYIAEIVLNGKKIYQASFEDPDEAIKQRKLKEIELSLANPNEN